MTKKKKKIKPSNLSIGENFFLKLKMFVKNYWNKILIDFISLAMNKLK